MISQELGAISVTKPSYILAFTRCPSCKAELFAAERAALVPEGIRFEWCCDLYGHKFETVEQDNPGLAA